MNRRNWLTALTLLCPSLQRAASAQVPVPAVWPEILARLPDAIWSGSARLRFWGFDVYDAQLWVSPGFRAGQYQQHRLALSLTYLRPLRGKAIAERSLAEMQLQGSLAGTWLIGMLLSVAVFAFASALGYTPGSTDANALNTLTLAYCVLPCLLKTAAALLLYLLIIRKNP